MSLKLRSRTINNDDWSGRNAPIQNRTSIYEKPFKIVLTLYGQDLQVIKSDPHNPPISPWIQHPDLDGPPDS